MKTLNGKKVRQTVVKDFFDRHPAFDSHNSLILDHRPVHRWFDLLRYSAEEDLYNYQEVLKGKSGAAIMLNDRVFNMMSSYDYLGLIGHPEIETAAIDAINEYGTGTGGVRLLTGTNELHCKLEKAISRFKGTQSAMVLSSGYMANFGAITGLFGKNDFIIADESIHRSINDAIITAGVPNENFKHNDPASLKQLLEKYASIKRKLIIIEGVYSMNGDISPLPEIIALKERYNAFLMIDEAHSLGVLGEKGRGLDEYFGIDTSRIDIFTGSLSKAIPANGGFIAATDEVIFYLKHGGAPYMFSAALSPANSAASLKALEIIDNERWRLKALWKNSFQMLTCLKNAGVDTGNSESPVIPVLCGENEKALKLSNNLFERGFLANAVIYPAVPVNKAILRLCCTASQKPEVIEQFAITAGILYSQF